MKKVALVTSGYMPVPASLGGAVECLDDYLIKQNEIEHKCNIEVFSCYEEKAQRIASQLKNTAVRFVTTPGYVKLGDLIIYYLVKLFKPHTQTMSYRYILKRLYFIRQVSKILRDEYFDEVMIENHATLLMVLKKYKNYEKYKGRFIYHLHNEQKNLYGCENVLKNVKKVATVSGYISKCIKEQAPFLDETQVTVWRNCVDSDRFGSESDKLKAYELKKKYGLSVGDKVVLFTGRLSPEKGIKELLKAFCNVRINNVKLVIAGGYFSGDDSIKNVYEHELRELAATLGDKIIFTGFIDYKEMPAIYQMADVVVIPSIWNDPAPLTVIETITSQIPLITTYSGGIPEYADNSCAILLERNDDLIENLTTAITELIENSDRINMMRRAARIKSEEWTIEHYYKNFIDLVNL